MSQNTTVVLDGTGTQVLAEINAALDTVNTLHAGNAAPADAECHVNMLWADTANSLLKLCTVVGAPSTFITLGKLAANLGMMQLAGNNTMVGNLTLTGAQTISATLGVTGKTTLGNTLDEIKGADVASAGTTDLNAATGNMVDVTGTTTITALGTAQAGAYRFIRFTGALTLTHNGTSLIIPGAQSTTTAANDLAEFRSLGAGNWLMTNYTRSDGSLRELKAADLPAAATTNLATTIGNYVVVTNTVGATVITALGTAPAGVRKAVTFSVTGGSVDITCNSTSLILPGTANAANLSITDGDSAVFHSLGSGNWRMTSLQKNTLTSQLWTIQNKSAGYTVTAADKGAYFIYAQTADVVLALPAVGTAGANFVFAVSNRGTAGTKVTIDPNGAELIDGLATLDLYPGSACAFICDGTGWRRMDTGLVGAIPTFTTGTAVFNASGSWTVPAGIYQARYTAIGGGGAGGGGGTTGTAGGTGGSASISGAAGTITGAGGVGGGFGNNTTAGAGGAGGAGTGGTTNITGGNGGAGGGACSGGGGGGGGYAQKVFNVTPGDVYTVTINAVASGGTGGGSSSGVGGGGGGGSAAGLTGGANNGELGAATYGGAGAAGSSGAGAVRTVTANSSGTLGTSSTVPASGGGGSGAYTNGSTTGKIGGAGASVGAGGGGANPYVAGGDTGIVGGAGGKGAIYVEW